MRCCQAPTSRSIFIASGKVRFAPICTAILAEASAACAKPPQLNDAMRR